MASRAIRNAVLSVAAIAKKTAIQQSPLTTGTVIARNPDGTLVVSDGKGGCLRQAPKANVRVGQKIVLGTEPSLGQETDLPLVTLTVDPSSKPCLTDPRLDAGCDGVIGAPPCIVEDSLTATLSGTVFSIGWVDPPPGLSYPGRSGVWKNRLAAGGASLAGGPNAGLLYNDTNREVLQEVNRRTTSYTNTSIDPYADQCTIASSRVFLAFDTSGIPSGVGIFSAKLKLRIKGNTTVRASTDHSEVLAIVPSTHDGTTSTANWDKIADTIIAEAKINDIVAAGPDPQADTPYTYEIDLPPPLANIYVVPGGTTKLAVVTKTDRNINSVLPTPGLFASGRETTASGTPDDQVHVAAGDWVIDGVTYTDAGLYDFHISQQDGNGLTLLDAESYIAALVQMAGDGTAPILVKGAKGTTPVRPSPTIDGGIILSWITISCSHDDPSLISDGDIVFEPAGRPFPDLGNPNEIQTARDYVLFENDADVVLEVVYGTGQVYF